MLLQQKLILYFVQAYKLQKNFWILVNFRVFQRLYIVKGSLSVLFHNTADLRKVLRSRIIPFDCRCISVHGFSGAFFARKRDNFLLTRAVSSVIIVQNRTIFILAENRAFCKQIRKTSANFFNKSRADKNFSAIYRDFKQVSRWHFVQAYKIKKFFRILVNFRASEWLYIVKGVGRPLSKSG